VKADETVREGIVRQELNHGIVGKPVPESAYRGHPAGPEFCPQASDVDIDRPLTSMGKAPHALQQLAAREHPPRVQRKEVQEVVLNLGERDALATQPNFPRLWQDPDQVVRQRLGRLVLGRLGTARLVGNRFVTRPRWRCRRRPVHAGVAARGIVFVRGELVGDLTQRG
jgi:hypothetical protein